MKLVFVTQVVDTDDPNLGATVAKLRALAERCDELAVLCDRVGRHDLPSNCVFHTFASASRAGRGLAFLDGLRSFVRGRRPDAILAHMCPIYAVLAAPIAKPLRIPIALWYVHWSIDPTLRLATRLADRVLSVDTRSFPLPAVQVRGIGHGIDVEEFGPAAEEAGSSAGRTLRVLALGRTSPIKGFTTLLRAFEAALAQGLDATLELRGPSSNEPERRHRAELEAVLAREPLLGRARLAPPMPRPGIPKLLRSADLLVNPTEGRTHGGQLDKVVYEAAACGVPVLACNPSFDGLLGGLPLELAFERGNAESLTQALLAFAASGERQRAEVGLELRRRVVAGHSTTSWADGVVRELTACRRR